MDTSHVIPHRSWNLRAATVPTVVSVIGFVVLVVAFVNVFVPPLQTRFVSDTFVQFVNSKAMSFHDVLTTYIPSAATWYRPTTTAVFWFEVRIFGSDPVGYHVFALACHMLTAGLIYELARRLTGARWAALLAALIFLFCPQAHEPLWDVADLHTVLSGPVLLAALLA